MPRLGRLLLFLIVLLGGAVPRPAAAEPPIFGGVDAADDPKGERLTKAMVRLDLPGCSATVLSIPTAAKPDMGTTLLTAAHCYDLSTSIVVRRPSTGEVKILSADAVAVSEAYVKAPDDDLALVHFKEDLSAYGYAPPKFHKEAKVSPGETLIVAGFGNSDGLYKSGKGVGTLRSVGLSVLLDGEKSFTLENTRKKGACSGDSGGAVFADEDGGLVLLGVISAIRGINDDATNPSGDCYRHTLAAKLPAGFPAAGFRWTAVKPPVPPAAKQDSEPSRTKAHLFAPKKLMGGD